MKVGIGYDVHKLIKGRKLFIGGVEIPHNKGLLGWSDGDVLIHAVIDAILGALGEGDIGQHFPAGDEKYKGIASVKLLEFIRELLLNRGYVINNLDATVVAETPKLAPFIGQMQASLAAALGIEAGLVNVKGKTEEGLGFTGSAEGIKAYAVCLVHKEI